MLDIPLGTVKTLLHRARIELVARLAPATVKEG
jgi:DNA-directed RNA polymerase specialized sigma24 family protein